MKRFIPHYSLIASHFITQKSYKNVTIKETTNSSLLFPNFSYMKNILMCSTASYVDIANSDDFNCLDM